MSYSVSAADVLEFQLNEADEIKSILTNIGCLLRTWKGEVPLYRDFGISMEFLDRPLPVARVLLQAEIEDALEAYEPRATLLSVSFAVDESNPGRLIPTVEVDITL